MENEKDQRMWGNLIVRKWSRIGLGGIKQDITQHDGTWVNGKGESEWEYRNEQDKSARKKVDGFGREEIGQERAGRDGTSCRRTGRGETGRDEAEHKGTG